MIKFKRLFDSSLIRNQLKYGALYQQQRCLKRNLKDDSNLEKQVLNFTELKNRKVIKVSGRDAFSYMQMLITNNLQQNANCLNCYMTNPLSQILCDLLIYKIKGDVFDKELVLNGLTRHNYGKRFADCLEADDELKSSNEELIEELRQHSKDDEEILYLECDAKLADSIRKTLFVCRLNEDVDFEVLDDLRVFAIFPKTNANLKENFLLENEFISNYFCLVNDPRLPYLGQRLITKLPFDALRRILRTLFYQMNLNQSSLREYKLNRYKLGVGEGLQDHHMNHTLVNSFNGDILNGVDLYKGGFLGSTRLHRITTRKYKYLRRLLPFEFITKSNGKLVNYPPGTRFHSLTNDEEVGQLINNIGPYGIGYFKLEPFVHINYERYIKVRLNDLSDPQEAIVRIPFWWPALSELEFLTYEDGLANFKKELEFESKTDKLKLTD